MIDLSDASGLPLSLNDASELSYPEEFFSYAPAERKVGNMRPFLDEGVKNSDEEPVYRVYRNIRPKDLADNELRYDITVMFPGTFTFNNGKREYFRTAGHYHDALNNGIGYPEIYEILSGRGRWIIQKPGNSKENIDEAYLIEAGPGEKVCIPPGFGHITINAESDPLVQANIIFRNFSYDYDSYDKMNGACYRLLESGHESMIEIEANPRYKSIPELMKLSVRKDWFKGYFETLWSLYAEHADDLKFLIQPEDYNTEFFSINKLFKKVSGS